jgi:uncharacterized protein (TIGR03084 family)
MSIFDDLAAEQDRLEAILDGLTEEQWLSPSAAAGWTIADTVLHLAQTEEGVVATAGADAGRRDWRFPRRLRSGTTWQSGSSVDDAMGAMVEAERTAPAEIFERWRTARRAALAALRQADPKQPLRWVAAALKPPTLATTRLAEHWAHGLDIAGPLGVDFPDTARLRHIAWLGHSTLPYAFALAGQEPVTVYCELTGPDGDLWRYGPPDADSRITGSAGAFCRVGAQRLAAEESGLATDGPHAMAALRLLRNYAQ